LPTSFLEEGPFGIALLRPHALFGVEGLDPITHAMVWSMLANLGAYVGVSLASTQTALEHSQATLFVDVFKHSAAGTGPLLWRGAVAVPDLRRLLSRFLGAEKTAEVFESYARQRYLSSADEVEADPDLIQFVETQLAGAIGGASARAVLASVVKEEPLTMEEVMSIVDEASQIMKYSRQLEQKSRELELAYAELRTANERLKELDQLKDDFVSHVSHELRTPLTSIRAFSEILHDNPALDPPRRATYLSVIVKETERLTRLIDQILDHAKIEAGRVEWNMAELNPKEAVEHAVSATSQLFAEKRVNLDVQLPERVPTVVADRDRLVQVIINLLSNAVKFCDPARGQVWVTLKTLPEVVRIDIRDNGLGIAAKDQQRVFEKFRQAGDTLTDKPQGTGLGLPISREIIHHFGGKLWVESEPGNGATFAFTVPLAPPAEASLPEPQVRSG
jgi:signal transduction histidine kinase